MSNQSRSTQRYVPEEDGEEKRLVKEMHEIARTEPRWGTPRVVQRLRSQGFRVNHKRVERLWRREGLQVPKKQRKRRRLGHSKNGIARRRPEYRNHVWSYDFAMDRTYEGRRLKILAVLDEYTRDWLAVLVGRSITGDDVIAVLEDLIALHGRPKYIRSDNGPEFVADDVRKWLKKRGIATLFIAPGSPWENGYVESFFSRLRDELLDGELFMSLVEAQVLLEDQRRFYNEERPHRSLGNLTPRQFSLACSQPGQQREHNLRLSSDLVPKPG